MRMILKILHHMTGNRLNNIFIIGTIYYKFIHKSCYHLFNHRRHTEEQKTDITPDIIPKVDSQVKRFLLLNFANLGSFLHLF